MFFASLYCRKYLFLGVRLSSSHLVRRMDNHYFANIYQTTSRNVQTSQITKEVDSSNEQDLPIEQELDRSVLNFQDHLPPSNCSWVITASIGSTISIQFHVFEVKVIFLFHFVSF